MSDTIDSMIMDEPEKDAGTSTGEAFGLSLEAQTQPAPVVLERGSQAALARQLVEQARAQGLELVGPQGLLSGLTKTVLETALEAEMVEHLGYEAHEVAGRNGGNSRNGHRTKTVITDVGPVEIEVPRDRDATFEPVIVKKRQRRLDSIDQIVLLKRPRFSAAAMRVAALG